MTAPREDGHGPYLAMKHALRHAGLKPSSIDYINAHATSTPLGDAAENRAVKNLLLGEEGKTTASEINMSSTKGAIGHLLGAAGSVEAVFTILALHNVSGWGGCRANADRSRTLSRQHSTLTIQATHQKTSTVIMSPTLPSRKTSMSHCLTASGSEAPMPRSVSAKCNIRNVKVRRCILSFSCLAFVLALPR